MLRTSSLNSHLTNSPGTQSLSVSWHILQKSSPVVPILIASILFHFSQRSSSSLYCGFYTFHPSFSWSSNWSFCIRLPLQIHLLFSLFITLEVQKSYFAMQISTLTILLGRGGGKTTHSFSFGGIAPMPPVGTCLPLRYT